MICFLDTNVFLECVSIFECDWSLITNDTDITVYICFTVLDELDKFKIDQNNRRKKRAAKTIKLLSQILEQNAKIVHKNPKFKINVILSPNYSEDDLGFIQGLDVSRNDDLIIATVVLFNERTNNNAVLISHDIGIRLKSKHFFDCKDVPSEWLLLEEKDESQKENERLKTEIFQLKNKEPLIKCNLFINDIELKNGLEEHIAFSLYDNLSNGQVEEYMRRIQLHCPKKTDYSISAFEKQVQKLAGYQYVEPSYSIINEYNEKYSDWLRHQKYVLETYSKKLNSSFLIIPVRIELENVGTVPAESFEIEIFSNAGNFVKTDNLKKYKENLVEHFNIAPVAPKGEFRHSVFLGALSPSFDYDSIPPTFLRNFPREYPRQEKRDKFAFYPFYEDGKLKIQCDEMQHQKGIYILETNFIINEDKIRNNNVDFSYQVYAKNLSKLKTITHTIELDITRKSALDLIEKELKERNCI